MEEEYLLIDPATGLPVARAAQVCRAADLQPTLERDEVQRELLQAQVEVATPVCHELGEVEGHLLRMRHALGHAAESADCRLVACGAAPFADRLVMPVTATRRYRGIHADAPQLTDEQLINGMHIHLGIPAPATKVGVLNALRPWLPLLVALSANSPMWQGIDTGFASWRTLVFSRWPVSGPPPHFASAEEYARRTRALAEGGMIRDAGQIYWHIRLSERYPTIEIRAADVQTRVDEAVTLAGLVRALADRAIADLSAGRSSPQVLPETLAAAVWHGARDGCAGEALDPICGRMRPFAEALDSLLDYAAPSLEHSGDGEQILPMVNRLLREGNGAVRQRRELRNNGKTGLVRMLVDQTSGSAAT
ncbi:carboxylate-amine ligase [Streptacidiphilus jiangxiensis]|uniref:carboxylate-amine ligase n=1 Tax=Streptacidiphilus jiangxiensis TaxID=235985 RepID=UPI000A6E355D